MRLQDEPDEPRLTREVVFALLAIGSVLIGISRLADPAPAPLWVKLADAAIALAFAWDWVARVRRSPNPRRYAWRHSYEVVAFIPFTLLAVPQTSGGNLLRSVRLIRFLRVVRYARFAKVGLSLSRLPRRAEYLGRLVRNAQLANILLAGVVAVALGAAALLALEGEAAGITGYGGALWWSLSLFTTLAYAIPTPQTSWGYVICGALGVAGVAYIGVFTASLASSILRTKGPDEPDE